MPKPAAPLLGYNTNIRYKDKVYHVQTEDSGLQYPHIITHLFADGGRIVATNKTEYSEHVEKEDYKDIVKSMMQSQHKGMCLALRDGKYDGELGLDSTGSAKLDTSVFENAALEFISTQILMKYGPSEGSQIQNPSSGEKRILRNID